MTTLVRVSITVTDKSTKFTKKNIDVVEKTKCYDTVDKPTRRYRKEHLNKITTNTKNTLDGSKGFLAYTTVCLPKDVQMCENLLLSEMSDKVNSLVVSSQALETSLKDFFNKMIVG